MTRNSDIFIICWNWLLLVSLQNLFVPSAAYGHALIPSHIQCTELTQSYPITLMSKLFSSVPKREFAILDVSLSFGTGIKSMDTFVSAPKEQGIDNSGFVLIAGRSASGKTTLLRILSGDEKPIAGKVLLNNSNLYQGTSLGSILQPKPIFIDCKPDCYDNESTVFEQIKNAAGRAFQVFPDLIDGLAEEFVNILDMSIEQINGPPSLLSPSGEYLFGIARACMQSTCASIREGEVSTQIKLPCPVLLLDELLDTETSSVSAKVGNGLMNLAERGSIVLAATHRPEYLNAYADRMITFSAGKVLINEKCRKIASS